MCVALKRKKYSQVNLTKTLDSHDPHPFITSLLQTAVRTRSRHHVGISSGFGYLLHYDPLNNMTQYHKKTTSNSKAQISKEAQYRVMLSTTNQTNAQKKPLTTKK